MSTTKKPKQEDPWKALSKKLSRRGRQPRSSAAIEKKLKLLKEGGYRSESGTYRLPAAKTLRMVIDVIRDGASPKEVPIEVARRFDWSQASREIRLISQQNGVDPRLVLLALDPSRNKVKKKKKT